MLHVNSDVENSEDITVQHSIKFPANSHCVPLSPCPCCGSSAEFVELTDESVWLAECTQCGLLLGLPHGYASRLDLCYDWNMRTPQRRANVFSRSVRCVKLKWIKLTKRFRKPTPEEIAVNELLELFNTEIKPNRIADE